MRLDDESGDRRYFTIIPNYILNHSTAIDQALYMHMKRYAGERGSCFASGRTLRKKLGIGQKAYDKSVKYLLEHEWIYYKGKQMVETKSGPQFIKVYGIKDLWKRNIAEYDKGVAKRIHPPRVYPKGIQGVSKSKKGVAESIPKKNITRTIEEESSYLKTKEALRKKWRIDPSKESEGS